MPLDVLFTAGMLGLMAVALVVLGRGWPRSARTGGYRAGRGLGASSPGEAGAPDELDAPAPQEEDVPWSWPDGPRDGGSGSAGDDGPGHEGLPR
jgi:hypothetical protein